MKLFAEARRDWRWKLLLTVGGFFVGVFVVPIVGAQIGPKPPAGGGGTTIPSTARVPFLAACPNGWTQDATLDGTMLLATTAAHGDVGGTGGANLITPTGSNSIPSFTGNSVTSSAVSAGTPAGTNSTSAFTATGSVSAPTFTGTSSQSTSAVSGGTPAGTVSQPTLTMNAYTPQGTNGTVSFTPAGTNGTVSFTPAGTVAAPTFTGSSSTTSAQVISWPAGVPTAATESAHTHTYTQVPNHVHPDTAVLNMQGGTTAATTGTHVMNSTATGGSVRAITAGDNVTITAVNPTGGVATGTTAAGSAHTHTISWPAGVPTNATGTVTPLGSNSAPAFTGSSGTVPAQTFTGSSGTVPAETFTGTQATLTGTVSQPTFTGSALGTHQHTLTPSGTNSAPTFTGDAQTVPAQTFTGAALGTHTHSLTATGSVSAPSFTGDQFDNRSAYTKVIWCHTANSAPEPVADDFGRRLLTVTLVLGFIVGGAVLVADRHWS